MLRICAGLRQGTLLMAALLLVAVAALACGGGAAEPTATSEPTNTLQPTDSPEPQATPAPTETPLPPTDTPTPEPTDTPEPTVTPQPQAVSIDPKSFALTLDDLPPGFAMEEEGRQYTEPDYEPENLNPASLTGLKEGYGVTYQKQGGLADLLGGLIGITNVNFVYESVDVAKAGLEARIYTPANAEAKQISAPKFGEEAVAFAVTVTDTEQEADDEDAMTFTIYVITFRVKNIVANVWGGGLTGVGSFDDVAPLATIVEERLMEQLPENE